MKKIILIGILFLAFFSIINFVSGQQETLYCAEKTTGGAWCQNVPLGEVNTNYRYDRTACESTSYCSEGTCVNTKTGECLPSPQAICDPENGGGFYNEEKEEVAQCRIGCCILGDGTSLVQRTKCVEGKNEVYFVDSCENIANIYDAEKINDVAYWSYSPGIEGVEINE